jgi:hypothetical protein
MRTIVLKNQLVVGKVEMALTATQQRLLDLGVSMRPTVITEGGAKKRYLRQLCK